MSRGWSTHLMRFQSRRIAMEHCPRISIPGMLAADMFRKDALNQRFQHLPGRLELVVSVCAKEAGFVVHLGARCLSQEAVVNTELEVVPARRRDARYPLQFVCPGKRNEDGTQDPCGRRVHTLYLPDCGEIFYPACRGCHSLTYLSRQMRLPRKNPRRPRVHEALLRPPTTEFPPDHGHHLS